MTARLGVFLALVFGFWLGYLAALAVQGLPYPVPAPFTVPAAPERPV